MTVDDFNKQNGEHQNAIKSSVNDAITTAKDVIIEHLLENKEHILSNQGLLDVIRENLAEIKRIISKS
jgi:hypothetical protein